MQVLYYRYEGPIKKTREANRLSGAEQTVNWV